MLLVVYFWPKLVSMAACLNHDNLTPACCSTYSFPCTESGAVTRGTYALPVLLMQSPCSAAGETDVVLCCDAGVAEAGC